MTRSLRSWIGGWSAVGALLAASLACTLPTQAPLPTPEVGAPAVTLAPLPTSVGTVETGLPDLADLYAAASPGVVTIWVYSDIGGAHDSNVPLSQGSGFVIDRQGHIVTNQHVVEGASEVEVDFTSGLKAWADVVGTDPDSDLALLRVEVSPEVLTPLPLGDSDDVRVGDLVVAIGNPFGLTGTMTLGVVSAIGRTLDSQRSTPDGDSFYTAGDILQTDAALNPGNSGGPLINLAGEVVGVNRAIRTETFTVAGEAANSGVGFAIPVNIVRRVAPALIETGRYDYPYLGVTSLNESAWNLRTVEALGLPPEATGAYVTCVTPGGPAARAGLVGAGRCNGSALTAGGDLIVAIDGHVVQDFSDLLSHLLKETEVGQEVVLTVLRGGQQLDIPVTLDARP
ncbi:MAG TPA: trypsin-like peptidase domain-containing protein [Anaerolineales bacterium]|nr:trypsin-like peptidase domain-containing protein [Anaerolineales bacterium]